MGNKEEGPVCLRDGWPDTGRSHRLGRRQRSKLMENINDLLVLTVSFGSGDTKKPAGNEWPRGFLALNSMTSEWGFW